MLDVYSYVDRNSILAIRAINDRRLLAYRDHRDSCLGFSVTSDIEGFGRADSPGKLFYASPEADSPDSHQRADCIRRSMTGATGSQLLTQRGRRGRAGAV